MWPDARRQVVRVLGGIQGGDTTRRRFDRRSRHPGRVLLFGMVGRTLEQEGWGSLLEGGQRMTKKKRPGGGDFARGERTKPNPDEGPDFARGERTKPNPDEGPDFARGERKAND
jgi:hypothetical protein